MSGASLIGYACEGGVARITLDDPASLNGLSLVMIDQLNGALDRAEGEARAVILHGAGRGFCSGVNLAAMPADPASPDYDAGLMLETHVNPLILRMRRLKLPIVGAIHGAAAGVGCAMALACDLIVAAEGTFFLQAFRHVGLVPDGGSAFLIARAAGRARASEMMLLGKRISAGQALDWGLINRVVAGDALMDSAQEIADDLASGPPVALGLIKALAWNGAAGDLESSLALERDYQKAAGLTADHREGVAAFLEKRAPRFGEPE